MTPFGIQSSDQFRSVPPPALISNKYSKDYKEVKEVGELNSTARPQDRTDVARYATVGAVHIWNQAVSGCNSEGLRFTQCFEDPPKTVMLHHFDEWRVPIAEGMWEGNRKRAQRFANDVRAVNSNIKILIPDFFSLFKLE